VKPDPALAKQLGATKSSKLSAEAKPKPPQSFFNIRSRDGPVAQHKPWLGWRLDREPRERVCLYAHIGSPANDSIYFIDRCAARESGYVQPDIGGNNLEMIGEFFVQAIDNHRVAHSVDVPHFADVP
jgi:hypothetical protein